VRELFQTPGGKEEKKRFYNIVEKAEEKTPGVMTAIEDAFYMWQAQEETFATQIGFIIGLRIAGISSKRTKAMARTWRPGYPTDDRGPGQRKRQI
jgi:hypothetical protein